MKNTASHLCVQETYIFIILKPDLLELIKNISHEKVVYSLTFKSSRIASLKWNSLNCWVVIEKLQLAFSRNSFFNKEKKTDKQFLLEKWKAIILLCGKFTLTHFVERKDIFRNNSQIYSAQIHFSTVYDFPTYRNNYYMSWIVF